MDIEMVNGNSYGIMGYCVDIMLIINVCYDNLV